MGTGWDDRAESWLAWARTRNGLTTRFDEHDRRMAQFLLFCAVKR